MEPPWDSTALRRWTGWTNFYFANLLPISNGNNFSTITHVLGEGRACWGYVSLSRFWGVGGYYYIYMIYIYNIIPPPPPRTTHAYAYIYMIQLQYYSNKTTTQNYPLSSASSSATKYHLPNCARFWTAVEWSVEDECRSKKLWWVWDGTKVYTIRQLRLLLGVLETTLLSGHAIRVHII